MDPRKLKVNELKEQLQLAGLSVNGKKEELVARLLEHQKADEDVVSAVGPPTGSGESFEWDENKFDVDDLAPPADPVSSTKAAPSTNTAAVAPAPSTKPAASPSSESNKSTSANTKAATTPAPSSTNSASKPSTTESVEFQGNVGDKEALKAEWEKRKNRAARFGIPLTEQDKAIERAARFGVPVTAAATASLAKAAGTSTKAATPGSKGLPNKPGAVSVQIPEDVLNKRRERFGIQASPSASATGKKVIAGVDAAEEEKKRKRALKFGLTPAADDSSKKQKV
ncbi:hypothetical protein BX616_000071 [Lobosporangium transversale]|uniref:SAP domain-containing protein n=1 Tax=Lobosporangium transversale TaxID=64571 RepID=A0A1Y2GT37_9FUNG|nr:hypothetical protein BCR41DRAFT_420856 [Lobosporangium transversale]KAF9908613.1 hypothetical protein BX616_000071 [Lobosporangium transversale]ORZ21955.1 hypothetical protein BCR41DRAFT_420856 [Lobosporangium transversale]|eukprot:XP_021883206.1 hypothetical protein BCR41DRAFT_420856 [Lobosporangium transversale]